MSRATSGKFRASQSGDVLHTATSSPARVARLAVDGETAEEMKRMASLDEFRSQLEETAQGWTEQWFAEGVEHGRAEGGAAQRAGLRRQAALLFGASVKRLDPLLNEVRTPAKLAEIGEWIVVDTIDQVIAKVEAAAADERIH